MGNYAAVFLLFMAGSAAADTVSGSISYQKSDLSFRPARRVRVDLLDQSGASVNATTTTNNAGNFSFSIASPPAQVKLRVYTDTPGIMNVHAAGGAAYSAVSPQAFTSSSVIACNFPFEGFEDWAGAMFILDMLHDARDHALERMAAIASTDTLGACEAVWPDTSNYYQANVIHLRTGSQWDERMILHEYGHHVMATLSYISSPLTVHETRGIYDLRVSWNEGWANFFVTSVRGVPTTVEWINIEGPAAWFPKSPGNEIRVAAALWDLRKASSGGSDRLWKTINAMKFPNSRDVVDFYVRWKALGFDPSVAALFEAHGVNVTPLSLPYSTSFDSDMVSGMGKSYMWTPGWGRHQTDSSPDGITWRGDAALRPAYSGPSSMNYNNDANYQSNGPNSGYLESPLLDLSTTANPTLEFRCLYDTDTTGTSTDTRRVIVSADNFATTLLSVQLSSLGGCGGMGVWHLHSIPLNSTWGVVRIRFFFDTVDASTDAHTGWFIDDVAVRNGPSGLPPTIANLQQEGPDVNGDPAIVRFRAVVASPEGLIVTLQIEARRADEAFLGVVTHESASVASGSVARVDASLSSGSYRWRARALASNGFASAWVAFGSGAVDFVIDIPSSSSKGGFCSLGDRGPVEPPRAWFALLLLIGLGEWRRRVRIHRCHRAFRFSLRTREAE